MTNYLGDIYLAKMGGSISFSLRVPDVRNVNLILFEKVTDLKGNLYTIEKKGIFFSSNNWKYHQKILWLPS